MLGGNNISTRTTPADVFSDHKGFVEELRECGVKRVMVSSIQQRDKFRESEMTPLIFNKMRRAVNEKLKKYLKSDYVLKVLF